MKTHTMYQIREFKTPNSYSTPIGTKLRTRWQAIKLISRLTWASRREIVMVPISVNVKA